MCKKWPKDAWEHRAPQCFASATSAVTAAEVAIGSALPVRGTVERWHHEMFVGVPPIDYYAGNCRGVDPGKPCLAQNVSVGPHAGSPFQQARQHVDQLMTALNAQIQKVEAASPSLPPDERAKQIAATVGVTIGNFIQIHPFINGNGRTSRLLWRVLLRRFNLPAQLSVVKRPDAPYDVVMAAAMLGNFAPCIAMVLNGIASGAPAAAV